ncbi:MAG: transcription termination/antitermination protein NusA [Armatimonadetes bacterium]|nr:transcription termination/antitermination protein NusA [Armatimonadota bacterium]MDE2206574.1 transcription termination/antitermination protein NusA [Armatimonadota bacterium]
MNGEFIEALQQIAKEKEMPLDTLIETVEIALATAFKKNSSAPGEIKVHIDQTRRTEPPFDVYCEKLVVEEVTDDTVEITLAEARKTQPGIEVGATIRFSVDPGNMGRIAAQTVKQVVVQKIRETERKKSFDEFERRVGEIITVTVQRREGRNIVVNFDRLEALLPQPEQVESEPYRFNDRIKVYVVEARDSQKGPQGIVSRTHPSLIRRLFELEVPEIADGIVAIKSVAREPGARSKIAVGSNDDKVDPVGACVGHRGTRVQAVVNELYDEKVDIVRWSADAGSFIAEALSPAKAVKVTVDEDQHSAFVVVPDSQLSLAIGRAGQNVRLAARLTGWRIDIRSEQQVARAALMAATRAEPVGSDEEGLDVNSTKLGEEPLAAGIVPAE